MEDGKVLLCRIFNINPIVSAAVFALVMDIVAVDRPVTGLLMAAAQAPEIGVVIIRCHHTCAVALGAFHLNAGGQGVVCTVCKVGFINNSAHAPAHPFLSKARRTAFSSCPPSLFHLTRMPAQSKSHTDPHTARTLLHSANHTATGSRCGI